MFISMGVLMAAVFESDLNTGNHGK